MEKIIVRLECTESGQFEHRIEADGEWTAVRVCEQLENLAYKLRSAAMNNVNGRNPETGRSAMLMLQQVKLREVYQPTSF